MKKVIIVLAAVISGTCLWGQSVPEGYFKAPLDGTLYLSANFAEMRSNHFHSGIDIKTAQVEGKPLKAVADGYVARIGIAPWGFGRVLYIAHPNGYTSVYAHMKQFDGAIEEYVKKERYRTRQYYGDYYPPADMFVFEQGEVVGLSGNSGMSFGPHLHFEIRDAGQRTLNPISYGFIKAKDTIRPIIVKLYYFEVDTVKGVPVHSAPRAMEVKDLGEGRYALADTTAFEVGRNGYFAVETTDRKNDTHNTMGVYRVAQKVDGNTNFEFSLDRFQFSNTRYVNAVSVYPMQKKSGNEVIRLALLANNYMPVYRSVKDRGAIMPGDDNRHRITIEIEDDTRNVSTLSFSIRREDAPKPFYRQEDVAGPVIGVSATFSGGTDGVRVSIPANTLYESLFYSQDIIQRSPSQTGQKERVVPLSANYRILSEDIPLHGYVTVSVRADVPSQLRSRSALASVSANGAYSCVGGKWENGAVSARTRNFGTFAVVADTIPPTVAASFAKGADLGTAGSVSFVLKDNFSGVGNFSGTVDGKWVLFEFDARTYRITHYFDDAVVTRGGVHKVSVRAVDGCGNETVYNSEFRR